MVRKRSRWERSGDYRHKRPKTPAPTTGWVAAELAALTGLSHSAIRYYVRCRIISSPSFRGTITRYQRPDLLRILAVQRLRTERGVTLDAIRRRLDTMSEAEFVVLVTMGGIDEPLAHALGLPVSKRETDVSSMDAWRTTTLLPGLELRVAANASPFVQGVARRMIEGVEGSTS
ncbi:MAG TPA: MerR family transcriptional regulator [Polyangiaceae bacterium]|jgi:DNA-binding transcriptional MerR regulator|nr:MerR family transcriptional regulator [Polyangiaceae bacterium]